ncbi:MAG: flavoprotein [Planctomycetota bacterium]|jgi:phosphopantothenoylcysteine decarboxylase/phosphopantothenate--cysteine ligase
MSKSGDADRGRVLLGVSGGIAAYKAAELARLLIKGGATEGTNEGASEVTEEGCDVRVVMTAAAREFVAPLTFESLTGNPVAAEMFARRTEPVHQHIELARWAQAFVVAPATANILAKIALGLADDLLSTTALACECPVVVAPAMNAAMWRHPAVEANYANLRMRGVVFVGPAKGALACGETGPGRMSEPAEIAAAVREVLAKA